ncbi:MAG: hypothetical protein E3K36_08390 [Candidatus Brocadia sp.]|nr:hypothetical protein [Candidatus Brocadia sp.]
MKGILFVTVSIVLVFSLFGAKNANGQGGAQEVMKEFDDFQKSLSGWMKNLDNLGSQITALQKSVSETHSKEFDKIIKGNEEKLNSIVSRLEAIEKTSSVADVKGLLDSFGKTLDVLKKLLSDLSKRVEDQEVKTAVLEKRYQEAQRPLEPIKKAIDDLSKLVTEKLGDQEKRIATVEESFKTRVASLDSSVKTFEGQLKTISDLETRIKKVEKAGVGVAGTVTAEVLPTTPAQVPAGTETVTIAEGTETVEVVKEHIPTPEEEGFQEIGDGFYMRNVRLLPFGSSSQIKGEIKNLSDKDRSIATFAIRVFNTSDSLLFTQDFSIKTFWKGEVKTFNEIVSGYSPLEIARYEIVTKGRY